MGLTAINSCNIVSYMKNQRIKASTIPAIMAPWRYEASFNRWIGGKGRAFRAFAADLVEVGSGMSVLDLGSGTGTWAMELKRRVGESGHVAGVDLSEALVAGARRKAKRAGLPIDFQVASVERLPFADASMDLIVSSLVMHHLAPDVLARAVSEIRRVVKPGGRVVILDFHSLDQAGNGHHGSNHGSAAHGHGHGHRHGHQHGHDHPPTHHGHLHDHQHTLVALLRSAGFTNAHSTTVEFGQRLELTQGRLITS
ncbi:Ubiquinone/menaquinone biosynthesis C-methyltransferase UbiE [compost metagenome]